MAGQAYEDFPRPFLDLIPVFLYMANPMCSLSNTTSVYKPESFPTVEY